MPFSDTRGFVLSAAACAVVLALSGCGGGGGSASTTPPPGRSMAQLDPEPVALPAGVTLATAGTFTIEPGESVDRDGARFTCAAGGPACAVVVAERAGGGYVATVTGGEVMVAAAQVPAPPDSGGQPGGMEEDGSPFPDWPVADAAAARSLVGGSALSWSPSDIENHLIASLGYGIGSSVGDSILVQRADRVSLKADGVDECISYDGSCVVEYRPVMTYQHGGDIPIIQARAYRSGRFGVYHDSGPQGAEPGDDRPSEEVAIGGILDDGFFMVARMREAIGLDREDELFGASYYVPTGVTLPDGTGEDPISTGRWEGVLVGTGNSETSRLYRQFIIGDVDITVELGTEMNIIYGLLRAVDVEFSNVRNINTGTPVTLSRTQWHFDNIGWGGRTPLDFDGSSPGLVIELSAGRRGERQAGLDEVFGAFVTEEAVGAFGAKKQ